MPGAPHALVIEAPVELDGVSAPPFRDEVALALGHVPWIVVDLGRTTFVDSAGVGALVAAHKLATSRGGGLSLRSASERVRQTLRYMGLEHHFDAEA